MKPWMAVSFYTPSYIHAAKRLMQSLVELDIEHDVRMVEDQGSWVDNCGMKPEFILESLMENDRNIVWLDADCVVMEYPKLFDDIIEDFAAHWREYPNKKDKELLSGTLYFANNEEARQLACDWMTQQMKQPSEWDQRTLHHTLKSWKGKLLELPPSYTQIFDSMKHHGKPVIEHYQESRKWRR